MEISGAEGATLLASIVEGNYLSIRDGMSVWLARSDTVNARSVGEVIRSVSSSVA